MTFIQSDTFEVISRIVIGSVWVFHGLYSKIFNGIPRHESIVGRVLGDSIARPATKAIGCLEFALGLWIFTGFAKVECAAVQTLAIVGMNTLEIILARDLLISAIGMVILNLGFLALIWHWALVVPKP
jgi:uncharacterized membrane protein YphA (DoxX/SURF4 family)